MICQDCIRLIVYESLPKEINYCINKCIISSFSDSRIDTVHLTLSRYILKIFTDDPIFSKIIFSTKPIKTYENDFLIQTDNLIESFKDFVKKTDYISLLG